MIYLVSSSATRAEILSQAGIEFRQILFDFNENVCSKNIKPNEYVLSVATAKMKQFSLVYPELKNTLFADSCVVCDGKILGKPKDEDEAKIMLDMQSQNIVSVFSAMIFCGENFNLHSVNFTTYEFLKFDESDVLNYIKSKLPFDKAGAMMVEGFNKRYIKNQMGLTSTARGLSIEILKAFL